MLDMRPAIEDKYANVPAQGHASESAEVNAAGEKLVITQENTPPADKNSTFILKRLWDGFVDKSREITPASVINNGSRVNFGLKAVADSMGIASALGVRITKDKSKQGVKSWPRFIANVITSSTLVPGVLYKEKPVDDDDIKRYQNMGTLEYVGTKIKQAFNPRDYVVETVSLATFLNGLFTSYAGIKQSNFSGIHPLHMKSWKNVSFEVVQGALTSIAGAALGLIPSRERAWQVSTAVFMWRIPVKYAQAHTALFKGYPNANPPVPKGDPFQMINFGLQQTSNIFGMLFAGIKKTEDGQIIRLGKDEVTVDVDEKKIRGYNYKPSKKNVFAEKDSAHGEAIQAVKPDNVVSNVKHGTTLVDQEASQRLA